VSASPRSGSRLGERERGGAGRNVMYLVVKHLSQTLFLSSLRVELSTYMTIFELDNHVVTFLCARSR
jgi:hypothetical protein